MSGEGLRRVASRRGDWQDWRSQLRQLALTIGRGRRVWLATGADPLDRALARAGAWFGRRIASTARGGANAAQRREAIDRVLEEAGLRAWPETLDGAALRSTPWPVLIPDAPRGPAVILPDAQRGARLWTAAQDRALAPDQAEALAGAALSLRPRLPETALGLDAVDAEARRWVAPALPHLLLASACAAGIGLVPTLLTQVTVGQALPSGDAGLLAQLMLALLAAALVLIGFQAFSEALRVRLVARLNGWLRAALAERLMQLPLASAQGQAPASWLLRLGAVEQQLQTRLSLRLTAMLAGSLLLGQVALLLYYHSLAALLVLVLLAALLGAAAVAGRASVKAFAEGEQLGVNVFALAAELLENLPVLRSAAAELRGAQRWLAGFAELRTRLIGVRAAQNGFESFRPLHAGLATAAVFLAIATARTEGLDPAAFVAFVTAWTAAGTATLAIAQALLAHYQVLPLRKLAESALTPPPEPRRGRRAAPAVASLSLQRVGLRYAEPPQWVLDDVSLELSGRRFIAVVGPSGSGKSSLLHVALGLYPPTAGSVRVDGVALDRLDLTAYRRRLGVVLQTSRPFRGSLLENLCAATGASTEAAWAALEQVGLADELRALPMGLHTRLGDDGAGFSGGQIQRLMLARALIHRPRMLLLDEATSALDAASQALIAERIAALEIPRLVIAHRLVTVRSADLILVLERGRVVQQGRFDTLAATPGCFRDLCRAQGLLTGAPSP